MALINHLLALPIRLSGWRFVGGVVWGAIRVGLTTEEV